MIGPMPNHCPTCSADHPVITCAQCGETADDEVLTANLEPVGWFWAPDPRGPIEFPWPDGKVTKLPRKILICQECRFKRIDASRAKA